MAYIIVACPGCTTRWQYDEAHRGKKGKCKKCGATFVIGASTVQLIAGGSTPAPAAPVPKEPVAVKERPRGEDGIPVIWEAGDVILDLYEVKGVLGKGGMGKVDQVWHRGWQRDLAVKSVLPGQAGVASAVDNLKKEALQWVDRIGLHPNVVGCYFVQVLGGVPRVFIELVDGGSLVEWVQSGKLYKGGRKQALERILDVAIQFAWGLEYMHSLGLVHQDVKPRNVMMTVDGIPKLTDFGLARAQGVLPSEAEETPQRAGVTNLMGTRSYQSPEQAAGKRLTPATDIWSWGVSILDLFCGRVERGLGIGALTALNAYAADPERDHQYPEMPPRLIELLRGCFQPRPVDRPHDLIQVADALRTIFQEVTGQPYAREKPRATEMLADTRNNQAISLVNLGERARAGQKWQEALKADPQHPETIYNLGLARWRNAEVNDDFVVTTMRTVVQGRPNEWLPVAMLANIHMERGDCEAALQALNQVPEAAGEQEEIRALRKLAEQMQLGSRRCLRTFEGHKSYVTSVCLSADSRFALSGSGDSTLKLWELSSGRCLRTFQMHIRFQSACLSGDGRLALSGNIDKKLELWEVSSGQCFRTFEGHTDRVESVCLSGDGRFALSGSNDHTLRLWEVSSGQCLHAFEGHRGCVLAVSLSLDGGLALSGSADQTLKLWELSSGRCLHTFEGHKGSVKSVCLSRDSRFALSGGSDGTLKLWELSTGHCLRTFLGNTGEVVSVCLSGDSRFGLSASADPFMVGGKTLKLWEMSNGRCLRTFEGHTGGIQSACLSGDGRLALSGSEDETLKLWETVLEWNKPSPLYLSHPLKAEAAASSSNTFEKELELGIAALAGGAWKTAAACLSRARREKGYELHPRIRETWPQLYVHFPRGQLRTAYLQDTFRDTAPILAAQLSGDGRFALSTSADNTLKLWELSSGRCLRVFRGHKHQVHSVHISGDGRFALSGSLDGTLKLWNLSTGWCVRTFEGHKSGVESVCLSGDSRFALSGSGDKTLKLWELSTGRCLHTFEGHTGPVKSVCFGSDSRFVLSGSEDKTLKLWELSTGRCLRTFEGHTHEVMSVCLSGDGLFALSGSRDKTLKLWELSTGRCLGTFEGHTYGVESTCLSADGRFALSGNGAPFGRGNPTMKLWELSTGSCLRSFEEHTGGLVSVSLSSDGRFALSGSHDQTLKLWFLDWDLEIREPADWDQGAQPYLQSFVAQFTPYLASLPQERVPTMDELTRALTRQGKPSWTEEDFQRFLYTLGCAGYGWLLPEGVRQKLKKFTAEWDGLPASTGPARKLDTRASGKVEPAFPPNLRLGRNDPCPCGSGKKYKNCHMRQIG